jgi:tRNA U34 5-methylaminomethyl-2-thiouridine-forming methyltransferase MnmC
VSDRYSLVQLENGAYSLRSAAYGETFHPVIGPAAEAEALYVRQLRLLERLREATEEFVIWDVGLGAAGNPLTFIRAAQSIPRRLRIVSFDSTLEPLEFALGQGDRLPFLSGFERAASELVSNRRTQIRCPEGLTVEWEVHVGDFPSLLILEAAQIPPKPHAIFYDAFSPAKNPSMWTLPVFSQLFGLLDPKRPCSMPTYSRSTMLRVTLLLAGFFVGVGQATGEKDQKTIRYKYRKMEDEPAPAFLA